MTRITAPTASATALRAEVDNERGLSLAIEDSVGTAKSRRSLSSPSELPRASQVDMKVPLEHTAKKRTFIMNSLVTEDIEP